MDHGRRDRRAVVAVAPVDVLDDFLAPLVLEVDVDVRRLASLSGHEALEQQIDLGGIDRGDTERIAGHGVGGGSAPLAENAAGAREVRDVVDGEEVACVAEIGDDGEFLFHRRAHLLRHALRPAPCRPFPGQRREMFIRGAARRHRLVRVLVGELVEREAAGTGDLHRARDCLGEGREEAGHLSGRLEVPLGMRREQQARRFQRRVLADAGEHVGERPAFRRMHQDIAGREQRDAEAREVAQPARVVVAPMAGRGEREVAPEQAM